MAFALTVATTLLTLNSVTVFAVPDSWSFRTRLDLAAMHREILDNHPGAVDPENPGFKDWLEDGYRESLKKAAKATSYEGYVFSLAFYAGGFKDNHLSVWQQPSSRHVSWPGFIPVYDDGRFVVRSTAPTAFNSLLLVGDELISCDGVSMQDLLRADVFPYRENAPSLEALWRRYAPRVLEDNGNPFVRRPQRCEFQRGDRLFSMELSWKEIESDEFDQRVHRAAFAPEDPPILQDLGDGRYWIRLPGFGGPPDWISSLDRIVSGMPKLREARWIVFDVRGNNGGNSMWGKRIFAGLMGDDYARSIDPDAKVEDFYRASKGNEEHVRKALIPMVEGQFGKKAPELVELRRIADGLAATRASGQALFKDNENSVAISSATATPLSRAELILVTDGSCASACLDFADLLMAGPGAVQIGLPTAADTNYMELREIKLPSGLSTLGLPISIEKNRKRASNQPYLPTLRPSVDVEDTTALQGWVLQNVKSQSPASRAAPQAE